MLSPACEKLLNEQVVKEIYSANLYLSMSAWCSEESYDGYANWYWIQYKEELDHAHILYKYIIEAGGRAEIGAIDAPQKEWDSLQAILEKGLEHEQYVTSLIYNIANTAQKENDLGTLELMQWYIKEQVEEEDNASTSLGRFKRFGGDNAGLYKLDAEMAERTYTQTSKAAEYGV